MSPRGVQAQRGENSKDRTTNQDSLNTAPGQKM